MARLSTLWLASLALTSIPGITAWTLVWRNDTTSAEVIDGQDEQDCTRIWHEEGEEFSFDPEGPFCVKFYHDAQCDRSNGIDCSGRMWKQDASQDISAFIVSGMPPASMTAAGFTSDTPTPTPTPTSTTTATTTTTQTSSPTPTADAAEEDASSDDNGLSGGAIAGIVIGVLIAVALLCAASFYLGRRTGKKAATAAGAAAAAAAAAGGTTSTSTSQPPTDPAPPLRSNTHTTITQNPPPAPSSTSPSTSVPIYTPPDMAEPPKPPVFETIPPYSQPQGYTQPPNGVRMVELPGQESGAELSSSRQVQEMGNRQIQELEGRGMEKYIP